MWSSDKKGPHFAELIQNAPKTLDKEYLRQLYLALFDQKLETSKDVEAIANSLLLMILDDATSPLDRYLAVAVLQKMSPICGLSEVLASATTPQLLNALPVLFIQGAPDPEINEVVAKLTWSLHQDNLDADAQRSILAFLSRVTCSSNNPLKQDDFKQVLILLPQWIRSSIVPTSAKVSRFQRNSSTLSITEVDGTETLDFFTILTYAQVTNPDQFLNIQVFSMLRSWLMNASKNDSNTGKEPCPRLADLVSEELSFTLREYCLRVIDQSDRRAQSASMTEFQKACLVEVIALFDVICRADSGMVHSILQTVRRVYTQLSSKILNKPDVQDIAVLTTAMQFFMNHSSSVMHKVDTLYPFLFCDLLNVCYQDNFAAFEIVYLMKENLAQLCYHSSLMEKYFPTFFKVLAWWPTTFLNDFLQLLPTFMSQQTSVEVFHTLLDLPCLTAVLVITNTKSETYDDKPLTDPAVLEALKRSEFKPVFKFVLRKTSGIGDTFDRVSALHQSVMPLINHPRVLSCADSVIPLLKCYFSTFLQYADTSIAVLLIPALLERLSLIFQVPGFVDQVQKVFSDAIVQLFGMHPEAVFHCQKEISNHLNHLKNYSIAKQCFIHLVWAVGEYVSLAYSDLCRPEVITLYYQNLESTVYEMIGCLSRSSDDLFLKLISVSVATLAKLAARSQDLVPRAVLCLSKTYPILSSFNNDYKKAWKIVGERIIELLSILKTPNVASVVLSPPKDLESGKLHRDATSLPFVLRAVTGLLKTEERKL